MKHYFLCLVLTLPLLAQGGRGGGGGGGGGNGGAAALGSLKTVAVPQAVGVAAYVNDQAALIVLGKALFWDSQAGSDGRTACATCHFHAGADFRLQNQLSGAAAIPNATLTLADFPFHQLSNVNNNQSAVVRDTRQVAGSAGVIDRLFVDLLPSTSAEAFTAISNAKFLLTGVQTRQVTTRNAPSVINAVFNARNFWDGRARTLYTGATPFGASDTALNAWVNPGTGAIQPELLSVDRASLASQASGPILSETEMSYEGRTWAQLGRKLMSLTPLGQQQVAADDSVLGGLVSVSGNGLSRSYPDLIRAAFQPQYWNGDSAGSYTQMELNFSLFWALSIQVYESTLVSNDSRFDQFFDGNRAALTTLEQQGLQVFQSNDAQCTQCHAGPELTNAAYTSVLRRGGLTSSDPDNIGFFRTGTSPFAEDVGLGGADGFGLALFAANPTGSAGTFKSPSLRNVELTGPYFHNGSQATLEQVVDFYGRNGDFPQGGNLGPGIGRIRLSQQDRTALVAFLKSLTDERVRYERAPFDHPSLCVPNGHVEVSPGVLAADAAQTALDQWLYVPPVGQAGAVTPLGAFVDLLQVGAASQAAGSCGN